MATLRTPVNARRRGAEHDSAVLPLPDRTAYLDWQRYLLKERSTNARRVRRQRKTRVISPSGTWSEAPTPT